MLTTVLAFKRFIMPRRHKLGRNAMMAVVRLSVCLSVPC